MIDLNDVLLAMSNIPVDDPIAEIWGRQMQGGYKIIEYTGSLPITINANGDVLLDYRIYGASGGVGERTENLLNENTNTTGYFLNANGTPNNSDNAAYSAFIDISQGTYEINMFSKCYERGSWTTRIHGYDENGVWLKQLYASTKFTREGYNNDRFVIDDANVKKIRISYFYKFVDWVVLATAATTLYIPYGYKLPMTVSDGNTVQNVPVYIGENQLGEDEYVSFSEQKIYKDVSGTLTPTAPTVPLPEIPTIDGETVIDYDGDPKPSQMYVKYKSKE